MARRKSKQRQLKTSVFIGCEGRNTEPLYFNRLKEIVEQPDDNSLAITIYPNPKAQEAYVGHYSTPYELVKEASENSTEFDQLWVVYDKDGHKKQQEARTLAKDSGVEVAFSSISFEHWILLHFERTLKAFAKSASIIDHILQKGYLPSYAKRKREITYDLYEVLRPHLQTAFKNAAWLRYHQQQINPNAPIYNRNPYTDVDRLVQHLLGTQKRYQFTGIGHSSLLSDLTITTQKEEADLVISITNGNKAAMLSRNVIVRAFVGETEQPIEWSSPLPQLLQPQETSTTTLPIVPLTHLELTYKDTELTILFTPPSDSISNV